jgi:hypothetical protein
MKHNPTKDKRPRLAKSHLKAHIISTHCKDIPCEETIIYKSKEEKPFTALAEKRTDHCLKKNPTTTIHHQQPQTRLEK